MRELPPGAVEHDRSRRARGSDRSRSDKARTRNHDGDPHARIGAQTQGCSEAKDCRKTEDPSDPKPTQQVTQAAVALGLFAKSGKNWPLPSGCNPKRRIIQT